jgi:hypothetical protein
MFDMHFSSLFVSMTPVGNAQALQVFFLLDFFVVGSPVVADGPDDHLVLGLQPPPPDAVWQITVNF